MNKEELENCMIEQFFKIHDYYQIHTDKFKMNIEAPFIIKYSGKIIIYEKIESFLDVNKDIFNGATIKNCIIKEDTEFVLEISNGIIIKVFLDKESEKTSEPVCINFLKDNKTVIIGWKEL